jgi:hypothetical protein
MFGGERFVPIIGHISLALDMKAAMQESEDDDGDESKPVQRDAKGRPILSEEEKARKEAKEKQFAEEVFIIFPLFHLFSVPPTDGCRKRKSAKSVFSSSSTSWNAN